MASTQTDPTPAPAPAPQDSIEAQIREAIACFESEWHEEAILACERALKINPRCVEAIYVLGLVTYDLDEPLDGIALIEKAHELNPDVQEFAEALAAANARIGKVSDGLFYAKVATTLAPHPGIAGLLPERFGSFFKNLESGRTFLYRDRAERALDSGGFAEAAKQAERQLELTPGDVASLRVLARASRGGGWTAKAVAAFRSVLHGDETVPEDLSGLGGALSLGGHHCDANACHRTAIERAPDEPALHSRLLVDLLRRPGVTARDLAEAHELWQARHAAAIAPRPLPDDLDRDPERPLRVAYLSGAFHGNDTMQLFEPVLKAHRPGQVEVFCYGDGTRRDAVTEALMRSARHWTDITGVDDETLWQILRGDAVDIVVDLAGHHEGGRPLALARRPAPLALGWLGYPHAPGVAAIDYLLSDAVAWPETLGEPGTGEGVWRLPRTAFAWRAPQAIPAVGPLPAEQAGSVTFGVSADLSAVGGPAAALWAQVQSAMGDARLLILNRFSQDQAAVDRCLEHFSNLGLRHTIDIVNMADNFSSPFEFYHHVDLALDIAPCGDVVELGRALAMGVPVVTAAGDRQAGRLGASLLTAAGHPEWVAESMAELAATAAGLAGDPKALAALRTGLRAELAASALADVAGFTATLEDAYRAMWRNFCAAAS